MPSLVVTHVAFGPEALAAALWTLEGPLVLMDPLVDAKILLFAEGFATAWERTFKGLRSVVQM